MNNLIKLTTLTLTGLVVTACATQQGNMNDTSQFMDIDWTVQTIAGNDVLPEAKPMIRFGSDNNISGSATCNRLVGSYKMEGREIDIEALGTTMMACAPTENMQEKAFLDMIDDIESIQVLADGSLLMFSDNGETIKASQ